MLLLLMWALIIGATFAALNLAWFQLYLYAYPPHLSVVRSNVIAIDSYRSRPNAPTFHAL